MSAAATKPPADVRTSAPPPPAKPAPAPAGEFRQIHADEIVASATNFRKKFDPDELNELALDIRDKGVVEPIIVRPIAPDKFTVEQGKRSGDPGWFVVDWRVKDHHSFHPSERAARAAIPRYELVAGERRWRASKLAAQLDPPRPELMNVPAIVRQYTDAAALEVQIVENDQRSDLSPLERAAGFHLMIEKLGYRVETIAQKVNKSPTFVRSHLQLAKLPEMAAESLELGPDGGGISRSVAELIARIPDEKAREKAAGEIVRGYGNSGPMTYRDARAYVERVFMKELKGAPFDQADAALLPAAGPCTTCQHCTANTPEQYQGKRTDMCLLPSCFAQKLEAHHTRALDKYRDDGHVIVPASEAREMFKHSDSYISGNSKYEIITNVCYLQGARNRSNKQILGKSYKPIVAQTPRGTVVELCLKADVTKALMADQPKGGKSQPPPRRAERRDPERELMEAAVADAAAKLVERAEANGNTMPLPLMRFLVKQHLGFSSELDRIAARRGMKCKPYEEEKAFAALVSSMPFRQLVGLLVEMAFFEPYVSDTKLDDDQTELLKLFNLDFDKIKAATKKRREAEEATAKKAAEAGKGKGSEKVTAYPVGKKAARAAAGRGR